MFRQYASGYHFSANGIYSFAGGSEAISLTEPAGMVSTDMVYFPRFALSPDGSRVVYQAYDMEEGLWSVPIDRSLEPVRIASAPGPLQIVQGFQIHPDGDWVLFVADLETEGFFELYRVSILGGAPPERLGTPLPLHGDVDPARSDQRGVEALNMVCRHK